MAEDIEKQAVKLAALAHPARLKIVRQLANENACCVKHLVGTTDLAQSTVSQHLKTLLKADLVFFRTEKQASWYEINREEFAQLSRELDHMFKDCCKGCDS